MSMESSTEILDVMPLVLISTGGGNSPQKYFTHRSLKLKGASKITQKSGESIFALTCMAIVRNITFFVILARTTRILAEFYLN